MDKYDPDVAPDPAQWLATDESARIQLAEAYHRAARIQLPNIRVHAALHAVVENQLAEGFAAAVGALERLRAEGLSRHDAVHAIATAISQMMYEVGQSKTPQSKAEIAKRHEAYLNQLTASEWRKMGDESDGEPRTPPSRKRRRPPG